MCKPFIDIINIKFTYPDSLEETIKDISLQIDKNEKIALIGPNGAGKSTLLMLLNGTRAANNGTIRIDGITLNNKNIKSIRSKIGMVFQDPDDQLFCPTLYEDVAFGPKYLKNLEQAELEKQVVYSLETVNLLSKKDCPPFHLSFGEKKRASVASVISYSPEILILDEPTGNLDHKNRRSLIKFLKEWKNTLIVVSHDLDFVFETCTRVIIMNKGKIIADNKTEIILQDKILLENNDLELPLCLQKLVGVGLALP